MADQRLAYVEKRLLAAMGLAPVLASAACGGLVVFVEEDGGSGGAGGGTTTVTTAVGTTKASSSTTGTGCPMGFETVCAPEPATGCPEWSSFEAEGMVRTYVNAICVPDDPEFCWCEAGAVTMFCGPFSQHGGDCCYVADYTIDQFCEGRPFTVEGDARVAPVRAREDWLRAAAVDPSALDARTRRALGSAWARSAQQEHASVASFARVVLELLALGAPRDLVAAAQRAGADETEHAELAFGIATALAGEPMGPGPLDVGGALRTGVASIVHATVREGCIGETMSAIVALAARDAASDPAVVEALTRIAEDELRHAELAWRTVAWAIQALPGAREAARAAFAAPFRFEDDDDTVVDLEIGRAFGVLSPAEKSALVSGALASVIGPSRDALFAAHGGPRWKPIEAQSEIET